MEIFFISLLAKAVAFLSRFFGLGAGVTWPGEITLLLDNSIIQKLSKNIKKGIIIVAGTNGKTTTSLMIKHILTQQGEKVILNQTGANLQNGVAGTLILNTNLLGTLETDYAIFEVDEATLPLLLKEVEPKTIVLLNLFRDQLDRYGEVDSIARKWSEALKNLSAKTTLITNADDPLIAFIGEKFRGRVLYFGLEDKRFALGKLEFATDSIYCLNCGKKLEYEKIFLSHYGDWKCSKCGFKRPKLNLSSVKASLSGVYSIYNTLASILTTQSLGVSKSTAEKALVSFKPAFGRQEEFTIDGKKIQLFLSKNPAGFNQSIRTVLDKNNVNQVMFVLNDRIPDGTDVSWIWDVDFEEIVNRVPTQRSGSRLPTPSGRDVGTKTIITSGDRVFDMALRIKYSFETQSANWRTKLKTFENLEKALESGLEHTPKGETLFIFPTYSAMLDIRKIIVGRKIL